jgi:eukaryotic-like serine/threonine-protein kinase
MADSGANPGRSICGYKLDTKIRTGPHLAVFETADNLGRRLEVSCYRGARLIDRTSAETFLQEARLTAALHHENLCLLLDAGEEDGIWFTVSVAPEGPSLRELIDRGGALAEERVRRVAEGASDALKYISEQGLRHGDIRPETVFLAGGKVLVAPRRLVPLAPRERDSRYVAPEELRAEGTDIRSDLFSLGTVLQEALTGSPAFPAGSPEEALEAIRRGPPPAPVEVSEDLQRLIGTLLTDNPEHRPMDPGTVGRALRGEISLAPPPRADSAPAAGAPGVATGPAAVAAPPPPPRRESGSLTLVGGEDADDAQWDLLDEPVWISVGKDGAVSFDAEENAGAVATVEPGPEGDLLLAAETADPRPRVNGSIFDRHVLTAGDQLSIGPAEIQYGSVRPPTRRAGQDAAGRNKSGPVWVPLATIALCLAVIGIQVLRGSSESKRGENVLETASKAEAMLRGAPRRDDQKEHFSEELDQRAKSTFDAARRYAEENPKAFDGIEERFRRVRQLFGLTRWDFLALREIEKNDARREEALTRMFDDVVAKTGQAFEAGRLHAAYLLYRNFATDHAGNRFADRAEREAENLMEVITGRFEEDLARVDEAVGNGEFGVALDILGSVETYGSPEVNGQAAKRIEEIRGQIHETQVPGGEAADIPAPPDPAPADPGTDPGGADIPDPVPEDGAKDEAKALEIFENARKEVARQRWEKAVPLFERLYLEPHRNTRFYAENEPEIDRLLGLSKLEAAGYAGLFGGQVKMGRGLKIKLTYDFTTAEEEEDWIYLKPFADPALGSFDHVGDTMVGKGVGALVHSAVFKPGSLTVKARAQAVQPHDFGLMFFEPETMVRYFLFTVQNRYFTIGRDRRPVEENVIWISGGGAWSDTPGGEIGFIFTARTKNPSVSAGEWLDLVAEKQGDKVSLGIKKSPPLTGSALGDDKYRFPALRPALFVLKSEATFDTVVIEGELEEGWAKGAMSKAREKFRR